MESTRCGHLAHASRHKCLRQARLALASAGDPGRAWDKTAGHSAAGQPDFQQKNSPGAKTHHAAGFAPVSIRTCREGVLSKRNASRAVPCSQLLWLLGCLFCAKCTATSPCSFTWESRCRGAGLAHRIGFPANSRGPRLGYFGKNAQRFPLVIFTWGCRCRGAVPVHRTGFCQLSWPLGA